MTDMYFKLKYVHFSNDFNSTFTGIVLSKIHFK